MGGTHGLNQPLQQQKPEIEVRLYKQRHCQFELETVRLDEGRLLDLFESVRWDHGAVQL